MSDGRDRSRSPRGREGREGRRRKRANMWDKPAEGADAMAIQPVSTNAAALVPAAAAVQPTLAAVSGGDQDAIKALAQQMAMQALKKMQSAGEIGQGPSYSAQQEKSGPDFSMTIPQNKVGLLIGKGGIMIAKIQEGSGAHVNMTQRTPDEDSCTIDISGSPDKVKHAELMCLALSNGAMKTDEVMNYSHLPEHFTEERIRDFVWGQQPRNSAADTGISSFGGNHGGPEPECRETLWVDKKYIGAIIGKAGATVNKIRLHCNASVQVDQTPHQGPNGRVYKSIEVSGSESDVILALAIMQQHVAGMVGLKVPIPSKNPEPGALRSVVEPSEDGIIIEIPPDRVGMVIGKGGENITMINRETGCETTVMPCAPGETDNICACRRMQILCYGDYSGDVDRAVEIIQEKCFGRAKIIEYGMTSSIRTVRFLTFHVQIIFNF